MDQDTKAKFILALHKHSLQAFDSGGSVWNALTGQTGFQAGGPDYTGNANTAFGNATAEQGKQQQLATQLQAESQGQGPNPAQSQFQQNANQIGAEAAGQIASTKGINPAVAARMATSAGSQAQQRAAGQSATLQGEQQLAAQQQLGQQQSAIAGENQNLYGTSASALGQQNAINAGIAQQNALNQTNAISGMVSSIPVVGKLLGGLFADGGAVDFSAVQHAPVSNPLWNLTDPKKDPKKDGKDPSDPSAPQSDAGALLSGGSGGADLSAFAKGGRVAPKLAAKGGKVKPTGPGQKALKKDNSYANDKVPALLSEGEIVIPRSITTHPMAPEMAARFVQATLNKRRLHAA